MADEKRSDFADDSICVMLRIPEYFASQFPDLGDHGPAHITLVHCQHGSFDQGMSVCEIVRSMACALEGETLAVGGLDYFEHEDRLVAFANVKGAESLFESRDAMADLIRAGGLEVSRSGQVWKPHATLSMDAGESYDGPVPDGEFTILREDIAVMRGGERIDVLRERDGKWEVLTEDRSRVLGEFDTEGEARERLRQIEAAKAARADARSDEEKAEIRSRWSKGEGPNMGAARHQEWLGSPFAGPNRKIGAERERAMRVARRAQRVMAKSTEDWGPQDYDAALKIMAFIARHREQSGGDPIVIDGREGPSPNRAALMDWGFDPNRADRADRFDRAPAVITEPKTAIWVERADKLVHCGEQLIPLQVARLDMLDRAVEDINGWVMYPAIFSRGDNIQTYGSVREFRPWSVVKSTLSEAPGSPVELRHSADLLTPDTVAGAALGAVVSAEAFDETKDVRGLFRSWGRDLTESIEKPRRDGGTPDLSVAFRVKVDRRPGRFDGQPYDQRVIDLRWNSVAAEPFGRAGTSRVLARKDARPVGRRILLDLARGRKPIPNKPIYFDHQTDRQDQDPMMMKKMIQALLDASGMTREALAERMGMESEALESLMMGDDEMTEDQMAMMAAAITGAREDMKLQDEADRRNEGEGELRKELDMVKAQLAEAREDRDRYQSKVQDGMSRKDAADAVTSAVSTIGDAWGLPRKDGEDPSAYANRVATEGHALIFAGADAMHLVRLGMGADHKIEPRKDADTGEPLPITVRQMKREAIAASFGLMALTDEERANEDRRRQDALAAIDKAPDAAVDYILDMKLSEARERFEARDDKVEDVKKAVKRAATNNAEADRKDSRERTNILRTATKASEEAARNGGHPEKVTG